MAATAIELKSCASLNVRDCEARVSGACRGLARVLENPVEDMVVNRVSVASEAADNAPIALYRMLEI